MSSIPIVIGALIPDSAGPTTTSQASRPLGDARSGDVIGGLFGSMLTAQLAVPVAMPLAVPGAAASAQPVGTLVDRLANQIADALQRLLPAAAAAPGGRSKLVAMITKALSPPGQGPPKPGSLVQRLAAVIRSIERAPTSIPGQQNDIAGHLLDANSAKELPARQETAAQTSSDAGAVALARELIAQAATLPAAAMTQPAVPNAGATSRENTPNTAVPSNADAASAQLIGALLNAQPAHASPGIPPPQPATAAPGSADAPPPIVSAGSSIQASDVLARVLARAVAFDQRQNGSGVASPSSQSGPPLTQDAVFARLAAAIANAGSSGSQGGSAFDQSATHGDSSDLLGSRQPSTSTTSLAQTGSALAGPNFVQTLSSTQLPNSIPSYTHGGDPNAIVDQVLKGLVVRSDGTSSQVSIRLVPDHLGEVSVKLTVDGGTVNASIVAQNGSVRDTLVANQQHLARALADSGLTLGGFSVDVSGGNAGQSNERFARPKPSSRQHSVDANADGTQAIVNTAFGPPLLGGANASLFSYLA